MVWQTVQLGEALTHRKEFITIDDLQIYRRPRVQLHAQGIVLRDEVPGAHIKTKKQQICRAGELLVAEIDAKVGGFGIVPSQLEGAIVSSHYFLYGLNEKKLNRRFLGWFIKTSAFRDQIAAQGSTNYAAIRPADVLHYEIPLPSLAEQQKIVTHIDRLAAKISEINTLRKQQEHEIRAMQRGVFSRITKTAQRRPMREVAPLIRRPVQIEFDESYPELGIRSFGRGTFHKPALSGFELGSKRVFWIKPGDLLFSNVFAWEGAIAVAKTEDCGRVGSHRFITCVPQEGIATSQFLRFYFLTDEGLESIRAASPGGAGRNRTLGLAALEAIEVPVPPFEAQLWFDQLQSKVDEMMRLQADVTAELEAVLPAIIDRAFKGKITEPTIAVVSTVQEIPSKKHSRGIFYRRAAIDAYVVNALRDDSNLGRTKLEKISHLIEYHAGVDLEREPLRDAAGPIDNVSRRKVESLAVKQRWYSVKQAREHWGMRVVYSPGPKITDAVAYATRVFGTHHSGVDDLIAKFRPLTTKQSEIVATLYAAWNDLLLVGKNPSDDEIIVDVLENWHPSKQEISLDRWEKGLHWLRNSKLVPRGVGRPVRRITI